MSKPLNILLLGEYSNVHATLAEGLRKLGHHVTVISNGDFWKNYPRDVDLSRNYGRTGGLTYWIKANIARHRYMHGNDIVQIINPMFLELKAERIYPFYNYLRRHNGRIVLGAFGMDYYWVHENSTRMPLRYSDFNIGSKLRTDDTAVALRHEWIGTEKEKLCKYIANDCDCIVAGLYEYYATYQPVFPDKTTFIPFPIKCSSTAAAFMQPDKLTLFIGISKGRSRYKGTDIMLKAAEDIKKKYPNKVILKKAEGVPFKEYVKMMSGADAILDQLYSYTPSMNPLEAMSHGIICIGGGEPENYSILGEEELRPIINVEPTYNDVYKKLEWLVNNINSVPKLKQNSVAYVRRHHDYITVAKKYEKLYYGLEEKI